MKRIAALFLAFALLSLTAFAQTDEDVEDNGFFINLIEDNLSAPGRQIRLSGVEGALSSTATIERITISDADGVWFEIENAEIDWSRRALLRGRIEVETLGAERIAFLRKPQPAEDAPAPVTVEARPFSLPELPVSVRLEALAIDRFVFDESIFGQPAELSMTGGLALVDGALDTELAIERLDGPGGSLALAAAFSNETRELAVDLRLQEPQDGVVATLLNIADRPAIDLTLAGSGPLGDVTIDFALDAGGERIAGGQTALQSTDEGLGFDAKLNGALAPLIPVQYRDFFQGSSEIAIAGVNKAGGGLRIDRMAIRGAVLSLEGDLETGADGFLRDLDLTGSLGDPAAEPVVLPVPGGETRLQSAILDIRYGDASRWDGRVVLDRLSAGDLAIEDLTLQLGGLARNLDDPAAREVTINVEGLATGVSAADPNVADALGTRIDLFVDANLPPRAPIELRQLQLSGNGLSVFTAGTLEEWVYTGRNAVRIADLAPFSGLAGRDLAGALDMRAEGSISPLSGGFDLTLDGTATDLLLGIDQLDPLLAGVTALAGRVVRDEVGVRTEGLRLENPQLSFASDGVLSSDETDIGFDARLADLGLVDPRLSGALTAQGTAMGAGSVFDVALDAGIAEGSVMDRALRDLRIGFDGTVAGSDASGKLDGAGQLDALDIVLAGDLKLAGPLRALTGLIVEVGPNRLTGSLTRTGDAPILGDLALDAPDIAPLAAFALMEAAGALDIDMAFLPGEIGQAVTLAGTARDLAIGGTAISSLDLDARVSDAFGVPLVQGTLDARDLTLAGTEIETLSAEAEQIDAERMRFTAQTRLAIGTTADLAGELARLPDGFEATLQTLGLAQAGETARLTAPSTVTYRGGAIALTPLTLDLGAGSLTAEGTLDDEFDLSLALDAVPLDLANAIRPDLALAGRVDGQARVSGPRAEPNVRFDLTAAEVAAAATRDAGLPPVTVEAQGETAGGLLDLAADLTSGAGIAAQVTGTVPLGAGEISLDVALEAFPLTLVDALAGDRGLTGEVSGTAQVGGTTAAPEVRFDVQGAALSAQVLRDSGIAALDLQASGAFADMTVTLDAVSLTNPTGIDLDASGTVPLSGPGLDVAVAGSVPLAIANAFLAERDAQAAGTIRIDARVSGAIADPRIGGSVSLSGGTIVDPRTNIRLEDVTLDVGLEGQTVLLRRVSTNVSEGGDIAAEGQVSLGPGYPADLSVRLNDVRYTDGTFVTTRLSGALTVSGPLIGSGGLVSGTVELGETEISVAEGLGANAGQTLEQVIHRLPPPRVQRTLERAEVDPRGTDAEPESGTGGGLGLDVLVRAPNRIFVRGRGLDVELGGEVRLRGTTGDIQPVGRFELRRGRLSILGQRIEFDEGSLQLIGTLDPLVTFVARTESGDVTAIVTVQGRVSEPDISFSSVPPLPQDEVLARVIFNRGTDELSAFQLAQLAAAAAELAGAGGNGLFAQIREGAGLDDLDIVTEEDGSTALRAGKYVSDNVYLDVQAASDGTTRAQVNLDITDSVTARGSVATDGNTSLGVFYERDY